MTIEDLAKKAGFRRKKGVRRAKEALRDAKSGRPLDVACVVLYAQRLYAYVILLEAMIESGPEGLEGVQF